MAPSLLRGLREGQVESNNTRNRNLRKRQPQPNFSQAMARCEGMFPDMDAEVIEAILRSNNGAVDATMHTLWTMSAENEYEKLLHDPTDGAISKGGQVRNTIILIAVAI